MHGLLNERSRRQLCGPAPLRYLLHRLRRRQFSQQPRFQDLYMCRKRLVLPKALPQKLMPALPQKDLRTLEAQNLPLLVGREAEAEAAVQYATIETGWAIATVPVMSMAEDETSFHAPVVMTTGGEGTTTVEGATTMGEALGQTISEGAMITGAVVTTAIAMAAAGEMPGGMTAAAAAGALGATATAGRALVTMTLATVNGSERGSANASVIGTVTDALLPTMTGIEIEIEIGIGSGGPPPHLELHLAVLSWMGPLGEAQALAGPAAAGRALVVQAAALRRPHRSRLRLQPLP